MGSNLRKILICLHISKYVLPILKRKNIEQSAEIFQHFEKYISLSSTLKSELAKRVVSRTFNKGDLVHNADKICTKSYLIKNGLLRTYFLKDGKEISEFFCTETEWVNSPRSFMNRQTDIYYIDALENTEVFCLHVNDLVFLFENFPEMERYARLSMGTILGHLLERVTSLKFTTAKEKYEHFCETYHDIYPRIPLGMIASYLGITQETLSRIRAKN